MSGNRRVAGAHACNHSACNRSACNHSPLDETRERMHARDPMPRDGVLGSRRCNQHAISMRSVCNQCAISVRSAHRVMQCRARRRGTSDRDENGQPAALHDGRPVGLLITSEHLMRGPISEHRLQSGAIKASIVCSCGYSEGGSGDESWVDDRNQCNQRPSERCVEHR